MILFKCTCRAALVGGIALYARCFRANKSSRASSTLHVVLDRSYMITTNCLNVSISGSVIVSLTVPRLLNTPVTASKTYHDCLADFLPLPTNAETVSKPVNAGIKGNVFERGPSNLQISWTCIHRKCLPFPKAYHSLSTRKSEYTKIARTITSVSELMTIRCLLPVKEACIAWMVVCFLVSAGS